ncbi:DGQHR domain-containing protein [Mucilaginibacter sp. ZT4R22]|uniref:DGQHR domain-containing protein n=1 Tax=Mucilaginibacter pankratovii TaxID=2772110 RepID=A0ABR7WZ43_9SPHI|nr:DGQHR domain-containing protein [Mucilaginibacter pankratovii]MBD1367561.1 DGQHR domain-containing protein [Mucilaginibacter pankratovii]
MIEDLRFTLLDYLLPEDDIQSQLRLKKLDVYKESYNNGSSALQDKIDAGWEIDTVLKSKTKVFKAKENDTLFKDKVWALFAQLGFTTLNTESFDFCYDKKDYALTHHIDVFAKDDETVLIIECRSSVKNVSCDFGDELEQIKHKKAGIINTIHAVFPQTKPKIKYILCTRNIGLLSENETTLNKIDAIHFPEEVIDYYYALSAQLGTAARYQLLGSLFAGQEIPDLDNKIPAIEGKMGGHTYYSFSIEPEKLLKIGYVLHRNKANENMMPTYQRLIKKTRLKEIHKFIEEDGGYFPNSIIINIVSDRSKELYFERSSNQVIDSISKIGILHLPKKYRSAYIIDGQHRLYGYSNSVYKNTNTIPVVALVNLERSEQVRLFMQINENQKPVSKDLRNTLDADLLWDSESYIDQIRALKSRIAIKLGEDRNSPFYNKITIGEDKKSISTQQIGITLNKCDFLGKVKAKIIEKPGTFYFGNLNRAYLNISDFLIRCFTYLKNGLGELWDQEGNIIVINKGFYGITLLLNDCVNHLKTHDIIDNNTSPKEIFEEMADYLNSIISFYKNIEESKANELKSAYGMPGDAKYWRTLQVAVKADFPEIHFEGLIEYLKREEKENNETAFRYIREIENSYLKTVVQQKLEEEFSKNWFKKGVPEKIYTEATTAAARKNREIDEEEDEKLPWDQLHLIDYREIIVKNWPKLFESIFTKPGEEKIPGGKEAKTKWMVELNRIRNENYHTYYVTSEELSFIQEIYDWLFKINR